MQNNIDFVVRGILYGGLMFALPANAIFAADLPIPAANRVTYGRANIVVQDRNLTIDQQTDRVTLNWQSFDIGAGNTVQFNQPGASSVALNRIFQNSPSRINGALRANGQVYLVNQNGIVFGKGAQVNVGSLVASSHGITDQIHEQLGIVAAINEGQQAALEGTPSDGSVIVEAGAVITAASGGRVLLAAPNVENAGVISTPDGQAILAGAADKVYLAASSDPNLRGILVEVGTGGKASNLGQIVAERGNVSIVGLAVNQGGLVRATTSVAVNGSILLAARDGAVPFQTGPGVTEPRATRTGTLTLSSGSRTEVLPELPTAEAPAVAVDAQAQPKSLIEMMGSKVTMNTGAQVLAPGGNVTAQATLNPQAPISGSTPDNSSALRIEPGATIDVSGLDSAVASVSRNIVAVEARGNELRDQPLQRDGVLRGETVYVDTRKGTRLLDISGAVQAIERPIDERLAAGGSIDLGSEGLLQVGKGAMLNVSGGQVTYTPATYETTHLVKDDGKVVEISDADPATLYKSIWAPPTVTHQRWGVTQQFPSFAAGYQRYEEGYVEGKAAGSVSLSGRDIQMSGTLLSGTVTGRNQRFAPALPGAVPRFDQLPSGGALTISYGSVLAGTDPSALLISALPDASDIAESYRSDRELILDPGLFKAGFGAIDLKSTGMLALGSQLDLQLPVFSKLSLASGRLLLDGQIRTAGGIVNASANVTPVVGIDEVALDVASGTHIDVSAGWTNDSELSSASSQIGPVVLDGGQIALASRGDLRAATGAMLDADGGAWLNVNGKLSAGVGGRISAESTGNQRREFEFNAAARAYAVEQGGSLILTANKVSIGELARPVETGELNLRPLFFQEGGFSQYRLTGTEQGLEVTSGTLLHAQQQNLLLGGGIEQAVTGTDLFTLGDIVTLPVYERRPVSLEFASRQRVPGSDLPVVLVDEDASVLVDAGGTIRISSDASVHIAGNLDAPAGQIELRVVSRGPSDPEYRSEQKIWVGETSRITATGVAVLEPDPAGLRRGAVLEGGTVSMLAERGAIVLNPGSVVDVSGASTTLDLQSFPVSSGTPYVATEVDGGAGRISLQAAEAILASGQLLGKSSGVSGAMGGAISVTLNTRLRGEEDPQLTPGLNPFPQTVRTIDISDGKGGAIALGRLTPLPNALDGVARLDASMLRAGGFDEVDLTALPATDFPTTNSTAQIRFLGDVTLSPAARLTLDAPILVGDGANAKLSASYVALGSQDTFRRLDGASAKGGIIQADPTAGSGTLKVNAGLLELVGDVALQGFATKSQGTVVPVSLNSQGDLRLRGTQVSSEGGTGRIAGSFRAPGDLELWAAQIYPTTLTEFLLASTGAGSSLSLASNGIAPTAPLSGGGSITVQADQIHQGGVLRAPFGSLTLDGQSVTLEPGSLTSTSGADVTTLFGRTEFLRDLVYPLAGFVKVYDSVPDKSIRLQAPSVTLASGATLDVSGGGELRATEFLPGPGGSRDILVPGAIPGAFAILPKSSLSYSPYDPVENAAFGYEPGTTFIVPEGTPVPPGEYAVLPPRYALLGGYLVTPVASKADVDPGLVVSAADGSNVIAGKFGLAGTDSRDSLWSQYRLESAAVVRKRAEYVETPVDTLFKDPGARQTSDAGYVRVEAGEHLQLAGTLAPQRADGAGALLDIVANNLEVVRERSGSAGAVQILASELQAIGAASVLLGGTRERTSEGLEVAVSATRAAIGDDVDVTLPELILVAKDRVEIGSDVNWSATGAAQIETGELILDGDAALALVSQSGQAALSRLAGTGTTGSLSVGEGSRLAATGSIVLDASKDSKIAGTLQATGGSIALGASAISLGSAPAGTPGLGLDAGFLAGLDASKLRLRSKSAIGMFGTLDLDFEFLSLDAAGLSAMDASNKHIRAGELSLMNSSGTAGPGATSGAASLELDAGSIVVGDGEFALSGFSKVDAMLSEGLSAAGNGTLLVSGDARIATPIVTTSSGARLDLRVEGALDLAGVTGAGDAAAVPGIGGNMTITSDALQIGTRIRLPSGQLVATVGEDGDLVLAAGGVIDVSGQDLQIAGISTGTPGGQVHLQTLNGDLRLGEGALIDVSGGSTGGDAGRIDLEAPEGDLILATGATLAATSLSPRSGDVYADFASFGDFGAFNEALNAAGFEGARSLRQRTGDIFVHSGQTVRGSSVEVSADGGNIAISGAVSASGDQAGRVELSASGNLEILAGGSVSARSTGNGNDGGDVRLESRNGTLRLASGGLLDVSGTNDSGASDATGAVTLAAARVGAADISVDRIDGQVAGAATLDLEAVRQYDVSASGTVDSALVTRIRADNDALAAGAGTALARLGIASRPEAHLIAGVDVFSAGNLRTTGSLDLSDWRSGGEVGRLRLRSGGDLTISHTISDGFAVEPFYDLFSNSYVDRLRQQAGRSWSLDLVAGADLAAANRLGLKGAPAILTIGADAMVRTGTGDVSLVSSGDIRFANEGSVVYTAGEDAGFGALQDITVAGPDGSPIAFGEAFLDIMLGGGQFGAHGGDIDLRARGNVIGAGSSQLFVDWQPRFGGPQPETFGDVPSYWAVNYEAFHQGIGALGGGNISMHVGGDLQQLSVSIPTTGKAAENVLVDEEHLQGGGIYFLASDVGTEVNGGGDLDLDVGGDVVGANFLVARGDGRLRIGGDLRGTSSNTPAPVLALADSRLEVRTGGDLNVETILNPTVIRTGREAAGRTVEGFFFTYSPDSAVSLESIAGDTLLSNRLNVLQRNYASLSLLNQEAVQVYPASIAARNYDGDFQIQRLSTSFPSHEGRVDILAAGDIVGSEAAIFNQSDADIALLPSAANPVLEERDTGSSDLEVALGRLRAGGVGSHAQIPVHLGSAGENQLVAGGSIGGISGEDPLGLFLTRTSYLGAGGDAGSVALRIQQNNGNDHSVLNIGGNLTQPSIRGANGNFIPDNVKIIEVSGPGRFEMLAGGNVDLGSSRGVLSVGDTTNASLADQGASLTIMAGLGSQGANWEGFAEKYLAEEKYAKQLSEFLQGYPPTEGTDQERFQQLPGSAQRELLTSVFFQELRAGGIAGANQEEGGYKPGFDAIDTLFPGKSFSGDLISLLSQISTVDGGDIQLLAPGGLVNAGVASASVLAKSPDLLGVLAQRDGSIEAFVDGDFIVNQSRVFVLDGGDITIWSSKGDIDAGRGAKTALAVPPPKVSIDPDGNLVVEFPPAIAGSGIRAAVSTPGRKPGNVYLFAPAGVVDAGDAGIGSAGNITIGATEVIGADNIDVGGVAVGVPVDTGGIAAGLTNVSNTASSATNAATDSAGAATSNEEAPLAATALGWLDVFVEGFGEEVCKPNDQECLKRQQREN